MLMKDIVLLVEDVRKNVHLVQYLFIKVLFQK